MITVRMMLISIIDTIGMYSLYLSVSIRISPGNLPNHFKSHGAKYSIMPITTSIRPVIIIQRAIDFTP
jgi:hypothetical protein